MFCHAKTTLLTMFYILPRCKKLAKSVGRFALNYNLPTKNANFATLYPIEIKPIELKGYAALACSCGAKKTLLTMLHSLKKRDAIAPLIFTMLSRFCIGYGGMLSLLRSDCIPPSH